MKKSLAPLRDQNFALPPRPQPGDRADQRAFSGAGFAHHEHALAPIDPDLRLTDHRGAVVEIDRQAAQFERRPLSPSSERTDMAGARLLRPLETIERDDQPGHTVGRGCPVRKPRIILDQPVEGLLHRHEGCRGLHDFAEGHGAGEIFRRTQDDRDHRRQNEISVRHDGRAQILPTNSRHCMMTLPSATLRPLRSSGSPPSSAMLSPFSRSRVAA